MSKILLPAHVASRIQADEQELAQRRMDDARNEFIKNMQEHLKALPHLTKEADRQAARNLCDLLINRDRFFKPTFSKREVGRMLAYALLGDEIEEKT